jgi:cholesterol transport system auxiliary component
MSAASQAPTVSWALNVATPSAPESLDTARIALTQPPYTMDYYANAAWPDRLPILLQRLIIEALEKSGEIASVAAESAGVRSDYTLQIEIRDFAAHYAVPDGIPSVQTRVELKMVRSHARDIVASVALVQTVEAQANTVEAVVAAFNQATGSLLQQIAAWVLQTPPPKT